MEALKQTRAKNSALRHFTSLLQIVHGCMKINQTENESPSLCICNCVQGPMSDHIIFWGLDYLPLSLCLQELVSWYSKVLLNLLLEAFL